ncbi:MAG: DUF2313 domain-containing protein [Desulfocapsaceae bacterium]|nr:DUF2313 domain-containing protein [Desulfocapsaceae bacterium]
MSASNKDALSLLFPLELTGDHEADLQIDADSLDRAQASAEVLLAEVFADQAAVLLTDWERVVGIMPGPDDPLQFRRDQVVRKIRDRGGLSVSYFLSLAQALGYEVQIIEPVPFMAGWGGAGDTIYSSTIDSQWGVEIANQPVYNFRAGESAAGEPLTWWNSQTFLEDLFQELKPAHTYVYFVYL